MSKLDIIYCVIGAVFIFLIIHADKPSLTSVERHSSNITLVDYFFDPRFSEDPRTGYGESMIEEHYKMFIDEERMRKLVDSVLIYELISDPDDRTWLEKEYELNGDFYPEFFKYYEGLR